MTIYYKPVFQRHNKLLFSLCWIPFLFWDADKADFSLIILIDI